MSFSKILEHHANLKIVEETIAREEVNASQVRAAIRETLTTDFPLSHFKDSKCTRWRVKHGDFVNNQKTYDAFTEKDIQNFSYFKPFNLMSGNELNDYTESQHFTIDQFYVVYVEYEWDGYEVVDWESKPFKERQMYDHLIFPVI